ncbi:MAG: cytochrome c family protein [Rhodospirillales bacterium]|nr:cytochrome c family protein [Rhodospirillales bacterium]
MIGESLIPRAQPPQSTGAAVVAKAKTSAPAKQAAPEEIEDIGALLASASPDAGKKTFKKCKACHTIGKGEASKVGPNLWDVVGADRAARDGFKYSAAMAGLGGNWGFEELNAFLTKPKAYAPGTKMAFAGIKKAADRAAVIVFLRGQSDAPVSLP